MNRISLTYKSSMANSALFISLSNTSHSLPQRPNPTPKPAREMHFLLDPV